VLERGAARRAGADPERVHVWRAHADATIVADTLSVRYNAIMQLTDFEDAVYTRAS
jgi:hypothetical protein